MNKKWYDKEFEQLEEDLINGLITQYEYNRAQIEIEREIDERELNY